jgi:hypothetical protein
MLGSWCNGIVAVLGVNCTKKAIYIAEIDGGGRAVTVKKAWAPVYWTLSKPVDIVTVYAGIKLVLDACSRTGITRVYLLACASGAMGADNDTVKVEGIVEFAAAQLGMGIEHVTPQGVRSTLGCAKGERWQDKSRALLDPRSGIAHWSEGMGGAVAAVFKATLPPAPKTAPRKATGSR